jgi:hypothetical protein
MSERAILRLTRTSICYRYASRGLHSGRHCWATHSLSIPFRRRVLEILSPGFESLRLTSSLLARELKQSRAPFWTCRLPPMIATEPMSRTFIVHLEPYQDELVAKDFVPRFKLYNQSSSLGLSAAKSCVELRLGHGRYGHLVLLTSINQREITQPLSKRPRIKSPQRATRTSKGLRELEQFSL